MLRTNILFKLEEKTLVAHLHVQWIKGFHLVELLLRAITLAERRQTPSQQKCAGGRALQERPRAVVCGSPMCGCWGLIVSSISVLRGRYDFIIGAVGLNSSEL